MAVVRGVRDRRFRFTQVLNSMLEDDKLSLKAKGLITYCLSKPDGWKFHIRYLVQYLMEGEKAISSTLKEMETKGYAVRYQPRKENGGDYASWETIVSDSKEEIALIKEELKNDPGFQKSFAQRLFGEAQDGRAQDASLSNNDMVAIHERAATTVNEVPAAVFVNEINEAALPPAVALFKEKESEDVGIDRALNTQPAIPLDSKSPVSEAGKKEILGSIPVLAKQNKPIQEKSRVAKRTKPSTSNRLKASTSTLPASSSITPQTETETSPAAKRVKPLTEEKQAVVGWLEFQGIEAKYDTLTYWAHNYPQPIIEKAVSAFHEASKKIKMYNPAGFFRTQLDDLVSRANRPLSEADLVRLEGR